MKNMRFFSYWLPPLLWMALIFYFSSRFRVSVTGEFFFDFIIFKTLHVAEYAILYFLLFRALLFHNKSGFIKKNQAFMAFTIAFIYALSDEFHQTFVPTREGKIRDVIIDSFGIVLMYIYIRLGFFPFKKLLK